jgi:hypothetical protein
MKLLHRVVAGVCNGRLLWDIVGCFYKYETAAQFKRILGVWCFTKMKLIVIKINLDEKYT